MSFDAGKLIPVPTDILWQEGSWLVLVSTMNYLLIVFCYGIMITNNHPRFFIFPDPSLYNERPFGSVMVQNMAFSSLLFIIQSFTLLIKS